MQKSFIAAASQPLILSILAVEECYGYKIVQKLNAMLQGEMEWPEATLYPMLKRMEKTGLVRSKWTVADQERPRKYYFITEAGIAELKRANKRWHHISSIIQSLCHQSLDVDIPPLTEEK